MGQAAFRLTGMEDVTWFLESPSPSPIGWRPSSSICWTDHPCGARSYGDAETDKAANVSNILSHEDKTVDEEERRRMDLDVWLAKTATLISTSEAGTHWFWFPAVSVHLQLLGITKLSTYVDASALDGGVHIYPASFRSAPGAAFGLTPPPDSSEPDSGSSSRRLTLPVAQRNKIVHSDVWTKAPISLVVVTYHSAVTYTSLIHLDIQLPTKSTPLSVNIRSLP
ncbi:hypothetical protein FRC12_003628 [Ceratobasidium sp. 428]|nr:hypothetical protein FRC12_003628 [Ceratobasidium sp. 428]